MKLVKTVTIETIHRGIALIFVTEDGEAVSLKFTKFEARQLGLRLLRLLGTKRGEGEED
jgi:hypothetical protein